MDGERRAFKAVILVFIAAIMLVPVQVMTADSTSEGYTGYTFDNIHPFSIDTSANMDDFYPDGSLEKAVYLKSIGTDILNSIVVCDADGSDPVLVHSGKDVIKGAVFDINDTRILFKAEQYNGSRVIVSLNLLIRNGSTWGPDAVFRQIYWNYLDETDITGFQWTYDGNIVFSMDFSVSPRYRGIYLVRADGTGLRCIMHLSEIPYYPYISSNGTLYYYQPYSGFVYSYPKPYDNGQSANPSYIGRSKDVRYLPDGRMAFISSRETYPIESGTSVWISDGENETLIIPGRMFGDGTEVVSYFFSEDMKKLVFFVSDGYGTGLKAYYATDETGEWGDSDGDGVWNGVDGAPDDPAQGYSRVPLVPDYPTYTPPSSLISGFAVCTAAFLIIAAIIVLFFIHVARTSARKEIPYSPPRMEEADVCPICGTPLVEKKGRKYCEKCRIYF